MSEQKKPWEPGAEMPEAPTQTKAAPVQPVAPVEVTTPAPVEAPPVGNLNKDGHVPGQLVTFDEIMAQRRRLKK